MSLIAPRSIRNEKARLLALARHHDDYRTRGQSLADWGYVGRLIRPTITLRPATWRDVYRLYRWRNDPSAYRYFLTPQPVPLLAHLLWLARVFRDPMRELSVVSFGSAQIGTCRVDYADGRDGYAKQGDITITVEASYRANGYGEAILDQIIRRRRPGYTLRAAIHSQNQASLHLFKDAGFHAVYGIGQWNVFVLDWPEACTSSPTGSAA